MSLNLMHFVQQLFQHPTAGQAASNAHAQVQQLPAQHAVQLHQMLIQHPAVQQQLQAHGQTMSRPLQVMAMAHSANLGVPYMYNGPALSIGQGGDYNPGLVHMQAGGNPQMGAFQDQPGQLNASLPQYRIQPGQEWLP